jgi:hypothetical protein
VKRWRRSFVVGNVRRLWQHGWTENLSCFVTTAKNIPFRLTNPHDPNEFPRFVAIVARTNRKRMHACSTRNRWTNHACHVACGKFIHAKPHRYGTAADSFVDDSSFRWFRRAA